MELDRLMRIIWMSCWIPGILSETNKTSTESVKYRLVGGASHCHGDLEMKGHDGKWKPVEGYYWSRKLGNRVCAELDCGSAVSIEYRVNRSFIDNWKIQQGCDEPSHSNCFKSEKYLLSSLELNCSDFVRLVNGSSVCSGRLEVRYNKSSSWSSVCEGHLDLGSAQVLCRELGCGAPGLFQEALSGESEGPVVKMFQCKGHESSLLDCGSSGAQNCSSETAVNLTCTDHNDVRMLKGATRCDGEVHIKYHGEWRHLGFDGSSDPWTNAAIQMICRQLDCGSPLSASYPYSLGSKWLVSPTCLISASTLIDCVITNPGYIRNIMSITCSDSVRLVNGSSLCSGRLEVHSNQSWYSVCEEDLDLNDTQVVCRELGCKTSGLLQGGLYGEGKAPVWTSEFQCVGNESGILDCGRSSSAGKNCSNGTAAGITCTDRGDARLTGEPSRCAGLLEIHIWGNWTPVVNPDEHWDWDLKSAFAVCQYLNCGSAVSVNTTHASRERLGLFVSVPCLKVKSGLDNCIVQPFVHSSAVNVVCSDLLPQPNISLSDGVFEVYQQGFRVLVGSGFTITCSIQPLYPGGSFQLISDTKKPQNYSLKAVNHSAHFLVSPMSHYRRGNYTCIYHVDAYNQSFTSPQSTAIYLTIGDLVTNLIIRVVLVHIILIIGIISLFFSFYCQAKKGHCGLKTWRTP